MDTCIVCGGGLPEVSLRTRDPFCSTACAREHHGTGTRGERARARQQQMQRHIEEGTDPASLELRRVTVDDRQRLIAEGRFVDEFIKAYREHLIAHKEPVTTPTVTWFSPRGSGPTMRLWDEDDDPWYERPALETGELEAPSADSERVEHSASPCGESRLGSTAE